MAQLGTPPKNDGFTGPVWIGYEDQAMEGTFEWTDGSPIGYTNWRPNEPNDLNGSKDCTEIRMNVAWNNNSCDEEFRFICEIEKIPQSCP